MEIQSVLAKCNAEGIRTESDKRQLADAWLGLAVSCAKIPVKYEADLLKQQQKRMDEAVQSPEQTESPSMAVTLQMM